MEIHSSKQRGSTTRRLGTLAAIVAVTVAGAAACASTTATAKPSSSVSASAGSPSGSPSIQPGGPITPVPSGSASTPSGAASGASAAKGIGYTVNGDKLSVYFYAGICDSYGLHADESTPGRVQVTVVVTVTPKPGRSCPMLVREQQADATLTSPLDGRAVVDTGTDKQLPQLSMPGGTKFYSPGPVKIGG